ncbi:MAG: NUDIX domain-containing protein [Pseudomonadota bacterium]|nr:MAG: ADP-ribose diphosphatase [Pseudomonadota bacterium]
MAQRRLRASIRKVTPLYSGFLKVNRYEIEAEKHGGGFVTVALEVMERGHAVAVLGYDPVRDEVVLVNELRAGELAAGDYPFGEALVAGGIGGDETPIDAAIREMKEETGLELRDPQLVHPGAYVSPGGTSEKVAIVFGTVDTSRAGGVHGNRNEHEDILTVVLPAQELIDRARRGEISDLKTLFAAYWLAEYRARSKPAA